MPKSSKKKMAALDAALELFRAWGREGGKKVAGKLALQDFQTKLPVLYRVRYGYQARAAAISDVTLVLEDNYRSLSIEGIDQAQVDALFALVLRELDDYTTWFGGGAFRLIS